VQFPHWPSPQLYLVPVNPNISRNIHNSGVLGSASRDCVFPLTDKVICCQRQLDFPISDN
jgi:hypothetical protein